MKTRIAGLAICSLFLLAACASRHGANSPKLDHNLITHQQIQDNHFQNAYEAVVALHPNWLQPRGPDSFSAVSRVEVYQDAAHVGGIDQLRAIAASTITYIRWYDGVSAQQRFGVGHNNGVIYVSSHPDE